MLIIQSAGKPAALLSGALFIGLSSASELENLRAAGVKEVWVEPATWDGFNGKAIGQPQREA